LIAEIDTNLRKKIKLPNAMIEAIIHLLRENCQFYRPSHIQSSACRDPKDLHILGLAEAGDAEAIVTGDNDLLTLRTFGACRILTPRQFSELIHGK
jgi:putative PIN family toxin of toxin-antitoxin system